MLIGIGINVENSEPTTCFKQMAGDQGDKFSRETVLAAFFNSFERIYDIFEEKGFDPFQASYLEHWIHSYV